MADPKSALQKGQHTSRCLPHGWEESRSEVTHAKNLATSTSFIEVASAQGSVKRVKKSMLHKKIGLRPYTSLIGAKTRHPHASPRRYTVTPSVMRSSCWM